MPKLDILGDAFQLTNAYDYKQAAALGGVWDGRNCRWKLPRSLRIYQLQGIPNLDITPAAQQRLDELIKLSDLHRTSDAKLPDELGNGIDPYQRVGIEFLTTAKRAILADGVGLGKTAQAIRAAELVKSSRNLVITKKSLVFNWLEQLGLWATCPGCQWDVTNYEQVVRRLDDYRKREYTAVIIDEAHACKNRKAQRTQAVAALTRKTPYVWLLTGTPLRSRPDELWSLLHIADPTRFTSYWRFVNTYCEQADNPWSGGKTILGLKGGVDEELAYELAPVMLGREKQTVALPPLTTETVRVRLTPYQEKLYNQLLKEFYAVIDAETREVLYTPTILAQLTRLRQVTCTPALIGGKDESSKTETIVDLLETYTADHKVLVFTTFAQYADCLHATIPNSVKLTGACSNQQRVEACKAISEDPNIRVLVGTIGAMSEGLNIQAADVVIFANQDWVPDAMDQAVGRSHRRGQSRPVHVITLVASGTVDEYIAQTLQKKTATIRQVEAVTRLVRHLISRR